ncbi:unnamed protein product [Ceratitis capitata]|uniref:(Mediterranean fruit fly) hypothetical protein n=1 Tax=Ceratitis capitata TaxID=7213 RepID=A0A811UCH1_CERCA|nr:unnamed protein product [Ceratitis capitata]
MRKSKRAVEPPEHDVTPYYSLESISAPTRRDTVYFSVDSTTTRTSTRHMSTATRSRSTRPANTAEFGAQTTASIRELEGSKEAKDTPVVESSKELRQPVLTVDRDTGDEDSISQIYLSGLSAGETPSSASAAHYYDKETDNEMVARVKKLTKLRNLIPHTPSLDSSNLFIRREVASQDENQRSYDEASLESQAYKQFMFSPSGSLTYGGDEPNGNNNTVRLTGDLRQPNEPHEMEAQESDAEMAERPATARLQVALHHRSPANRIYRVLLLRICNSVMVFYILVIPPDGGYGWFIMVISFFCQVIVDGIIFSVGILLPHMARGLGETQTTIVLVASVQVGNEWNISEFDLGLVSVNYWLLFRTLCPIANGLSCSGAGAGILIFSFMNAQICPDIGYTNTHSDGEKGRVIVFIKRGQFIGALNEVRYSRFQESISIKTTSIDRGLEQMLVAHPTSRPTLATERWKVMLKITTTEKISVRVDPIEREDLFYTGAAEYDSDGQDRQILSPVVRSQRQYPDAKRRTIAELRNRHKNPYLVFISPRNWMPAKLLNAFARLFDMNMLKIIEFRILLLSAFFFTMGFNIPFVYSKTFFSTLRAIIYVRTLGLERLTNAFGLTGLGMGLGVFLGTTTAAILNGLTHRYNAAFAFSGVCLITSGVLKVILPSFIRYRARLMLEQEAKGQTENKVNK